jgi:hypothetical protein
MAVTLGFIQERGCCTLRQTIAENESSFVHPGISPSV